MDDAWCGIGHTGMTKLLASLNLQPPINERYAFREANYLSSCAEDYWKGCILTSRMHILKEKRRLSGLWCKIVLRRILFPFFQSSLNAWRMDEGTKKLFSSKILKPSKISNKTWFISYWIVNVIVWLGELHKLLFNPPHLVDDSHGYNAFLEP